MSRRPRRREDKTTSQDSVELTAMHSKDAIYENNNPNQDDRVSIDEYEDHVNEPTYINVNTLKGRPTKKPVATDHPADGFDWSPKNHSRFEESDWPDETPPPTPSNTNVYLTTLPKNVRRDGRSGGESSGGATPEKLGVADDSKNMKKNCLNAGFVLDESRLQHTLASASSPILPLPPKPRRWNRRLLLILILLAFLIPTILAATALNIALTTSSESKDTGPCRSGALRLRRNVTLSTASTVTTTSSTSTNGTSMEPTTEVNTSASSIFGGDDSFSDERTLIGLKPRFEKTPNFLRLSLFDGIEKSCHVIEDLVNAACQLGPVEFGVVKATETQIVVTTPPLARSTIIAWTICSFS